MLIKELSVEVKAGEDGLDAGQFEAYASTFVRVPDSYGDVVAKGAFARTLREWAASGAVIPILWGHDMRDPFANIGWVVEAYEDEHGLRVKGQLDLDNPTAQQVYRLLKGHRVRKMSFAYDIIDAAPVTIDGIDAYELRDLTVHEVSIVPVPANPTAEVLAVKSLGDKVADMQTTLDALSRAIEDTAKASGHTEAKPEEPDTAKGEELRVNPSVEALSVQIDILSRTYAEEGVTR